ncbi:hypothetical protein [Methyloligella solikamskensis]|uniref:Uncharacterized protein n=1 Tax=Methyloligella solikamskensis TaxID=1177756 RepID=A0ABW3J925_9HYPH
MTKHNYEIPRKTDEEIEDKRQEELKKWHKRIKKEELHEEPFARGGKDFYATYHLAWITMLNVESYLVEHPSIFGDELLYRRAVHIQDELFRLCQDMGALNSDDSAKQAE